MVKMLLDIVKELLAEKGGLDMDTYKIYGTGSYQKCTAPKISGKVLFY